MKLAEKGKNAIVAKNGKTSSEGGRGVKLSQISLICPPISGIKKILRSSLQVL